MRIQHWGKNLKVPPRLKDYVDEKIGGLSKYLGNFEPVDARVELAADRHHRTGQVFRCEVNLHMGGKLLRAEETAIDIFAAVDLVSEKLEKMIRRYKGRFKRKSII